jgi:signal transduction histidine kinase
MIQSSCLAETSGMSVATAPMDSGNSLFCPLPAGVRNISEIDSNLCIVLENAGCPLALPMQERLRFETFLAELSATFVNVPADYVDSEIESALGQIVEFLGIDRSGFGEITADGRQIEITHSFELPGVPISPRCIVDERMPWYAQKIWQGNVVRLTHLPDDLPPQAEPEREYCIQTGLKSLLTIPLKVMGSVVGGLGFSSFRTNCNWPDELVDRLRLVGGIFTNAIARKRADEALKLAEEQARILRNELAHVTRQELINQLATTIAHEVNQPMCAIASNAQSALDLLDMGDLDELKRALHDIWSDARRGSDVIGRIRLMAKKNQDNRRSASCLLTLVEDLVPLLSREATDRGVAVQFMLDAKNLMIVGDRIQLQQVVMNLFLNAVEAVSESSNGTPSVQIRVWQDGDEWAHVAVTDSGAGLPPTECEKVFTPYFTTKQNGLGMGLSISRSIVEAHGGTLWAAASAEHGTTFQFRIPTESSTNP